MILKTLSLILIFSLIVPLTVFSETKEIIAEGTYNMGDRDSLIIAESKALLQAKRSAVEQAGTYVKSYSNIQNWQLTEDEIKTVSSGIMEVEILEKKKLMIGDRVSFYIKIKARVNTDKIEKMSKTLREKSVSEDREKKTVSKPDEFTTAIEEAMNEFKRMQGGK